jgi:hypothetical protein
MKWIGWAAAITLIISCFIPWVYVPWVNFTATGMDAGPKFRSPGYGHLFLVLFFILFTVIQRVWAKRSNLLVTALNTGWAVRNFLLIGACSSGECPVRKLGIWLVLISSVLMLVASLFPDISLEPKRSAGTVTKGN